MNYDPTAAKKRSALLVLGAIAVALALISLVLLLSSQPAPPNRAASNSSASSGVRDASTADASSNAAPAPAGAPSLHAAVEAAERGIDPNNEHDTSANEKIAITLTVECKDALASEPALKAISKSGVIYPPTTLTLPKGATVKDALVQSKLPYQASYGYVSSIGKLVQGAGGEDSAWFYSVNQAYPPKNFDECQLQDGDTVAWRYSASLGKDIGVQGLEESDETTSSEETTEPLTPSLEATCAAGTVRNSNGAPLQEIAVTAFSWDSTSSAWFEASVVYTNEEGRYAFSGLDDGAYRISFTDEGNVYLPQFWNEKSRIEDANSVDFSADDPPHDLDAVLVAGSSVSGTLVSAEYLPLSSVTVTLYRLESGTWRSAETTVSDAAGAFSFSPVPEGAYTLGFHDENGAYLDRFWEDAPSLASADSFELGAGEAFSPPASITLMQASIVAGTVVDETRVPLEAVTLKLYAADARTVPLAETTTSQNGAYAFTGLRPGAYVIEAIPGSGAHVAQVYFGHENLEDGDAFLLTGGSRETIDFTLATYATVRGSVVDQSGNPLAGIPLEVTEVSTGRTFASISASDGTFSVAVVAGRYRLLVNSSLSPSHRSGFESSYYLDAPTQAQAETLLVTAGQQSMPLQVVVPTAGTYLPKTVTFVTEYGTTPSARTLSYKAPLGTLPEPSQSGYVLEGWFTQASGGMRVSSSYQVTSDLTLYAQWRPQSIATITFDAYNGTPRTTLSATTGVAIGPLPQPVSDNMTFKGWYTQPFGNGTRITETWAVDESRVLFAHWEEIPRVRVTVSFEEEGVALFSPQTIDSSSTLNYLPEPYRAGYAFRGWQTNDGQMIDLTTVFTSDLTVHPLWEALPVDPQPPSDGGGDGTGSAGTSVPQPPVVTQLRSNNARLKSLKPSAAKLKKAFKPSRTAYSLVLPKKKSSVKLSAKKDHASAQVFIRKAGSKYKKTSSIKLKLKKGASTKVFIKVVAEDGTAKTYRVKVSRKR